MSSFEEKFEMVIERIDNLVRKTDRLTKEIKRERNMDKQEIENEAKEQLVYYLEVAKSSIQSTMHGEEPDEPEKTTRDLDSSDPKDRKIFKIMIEMLDTFIDSL